MKFLTLVILLQPHLSTTVYTVGLNVCQFCKSNPSSAALPLLSFFFSSFFLFLPPYDLT